MISLLKRPITQLCLACFLIASWPFIQFPFTDGDIWNWTWVARDVAETGRLLTGPNDQTHGPLLAWTAGLFIKANPQMFYLYALFTILMTTLGAYLTYFFSKSFWQDEGISRLSTLLFVTALAPVYLSKTPMYDWPAAICYFAFTGFYLLHIQKQKLRYLFIGLAFVGIGTLARFSIVMGLSGIFMLLTSAIYRRSLIQVFRDGILIIVFTFMFNLPWFWGQALTHGEIFVNKFLYDNFGRFVKSTRVNAKVRKDYYSFSIYVFVGLLPYTFCLIGSLFQKHFISRLKTDKTSLALIAAFLPCLILFSMSGHTKLGRYIAYLYPSLLMFISYQLGKFDLGNLQYRKRSAMMTGIVTVFVAILLGIYAMLYPAEVAQSPAFVVGVVVLLLGLLISAFVVVMYYPNTLRHRAHKLVWPFLLLYLFFFSILSYESTRAPFLKTVHDGIRQSINSQYP